MKVLLLNTFYGEGGAARAAARLHSALRDASVDAHMLVQKAPAERYPQVHAPQSLTERVSALLKPPLETLPLSLYPRRSRAPFFANLLPDHVLPRLRHIDPQLVHLHWVSAGFLRIETIPKLRRPMVWTLHDSWAFTGGCHLPMDCRRYTGTCGRCPVLGSNCEMDLSRWTWRRKAKAWQGVPLTVVTPSRWLARCAKESALFRDLRVEVIPNGLDLTRIPGVTRDTAREMFGFSPDKRYILFGAFSATSDKNKGFQYLAPALAKLREAGFGAECEIVVFGSPEPEDAPDFGLRTHYLGYLHDELTLNLLYSAVDLFVAPSMQENLPNTIMEAMACGTPSVAFNVGGIPDLVDHKVNGFLATPFQPESLAEGMAWVLKREVPSEVLDAACRQKIARQFDIVTCAERYLRLYEELVS
ncbi:glycosyltransferase family 4 protein [Geomonas subterranea]|uniref:Glycosyltransferase family 4 protein n=1 Tax=Geomonas subterranea TaxID=2847989 RepID=A0ABX8LLV0_9BACT|nr:glycosyltransferase family 4 protein [Geomonas subterranea]QXE92321.1 glycosyltransferase family 4 protein [Geomonas subterranea]QXM09580.1 glycosyltransferase family 4 protein [Geomonas subterranea]